MPEILFQDDYLVAVNKPHGLLTHRTRLAADAEEFALQLVRNKIKRRVFPVHRLDRKTSGVLLFGLNPEMAKQLQKAFSEKAVNKKYLAIVRGWFPQAIEVDKPLTNDRGKTQEALTRFECINKTEVDLPFGKFKTSRYSLIAAYPHTGRMHQIRKHLNHLRHPIIGDRPHGCNKQNKLFKEKWEMTTMLLHAEKIALPHPESGDVLTIAAPPFETFLRMKNILNL
ncbi:MAG: pseudouridine synthase [Bacteroidota bacterium]